jgi:hypothetical protein
VYVGGLISRSVIATVATRTINPATENLNECIVSAMKTSFSESGSRNRASHISKLCNAALLGSR